MRDNRPVVTDNLQNNPPNTSWRIRIALAAILACHVALLMHCALSKSIGFDEGAHLGAGLAYLKHGEMSIYNQSPPVARMWAALPAYLARADVPPAKPHRNEPARVRQLNYFAAVQDMNLPRVHLFVLWGRFMMMPFSLCIAIVIFCWANRLYGGFAALVACAAWSFSPMVIAHGSTLGTDTALTLAMLAAVGLWHRFAQTGRTSQALAAAVAIAIAHTIKFTALLLWPMLFILTIATVARDRKRWRVQLAGGALAIVITFVMFNASYGFRLMGDRLDRFNFDSSTMNTVQRTLPPWLPLPFHRDAIAGFDAQKFDAESQYVTALFGKAYMGGSWIYYPWSILAKTTIGGLVLLAIGLVSFTVQRPRRDEWPLLVLAIGMVIAMTWIAQINLSLRYLLPAYPAAIILLARGASWPKLKIASLIAVAALAGESIAASPRMHSFCNVAIRPWRWLVPDQDTGQSLIELRDWMSSHHVDSLPLIGPVLWCPEPYGIRRDPDLDDPNIQYVAISRTALDGLPISSDYGFVLVRPWRALRQMRPAEDLGGIVIYRMEQIRDAAHGEPWIARFIEWQDAARDPALAPNDDLKERLRIPK